ncbi:hypothetical protein ACI792_15415 [Blastococcus sp. SYSU DS0669]
MTTSAAQQTTTGTTTRSGLARRVADRATFRSAGRARRARPRRWTMDRIIAELNRGA